MCGVGNLTDKPYIYFGKPMVGFLDHTTCVSKCPTDYGSKLDCAVNSKIKSCDQFGDIKNVNLSALADGSEKFPTTMNLLIYPSKGSTP
jgi:hypothetical protein